MASVSRYENQHLKFEQFWWKICLFLDISAFLPQGRGVLSHDYMFWCGDFNYRIDMENELVKDSIQSGNYEDLKLFDQLLISKQEGEV